MEEEQLVQQNVDITLPPSPEDFEFAFKVRNQKEQSIKQALNNLKGLRQKYGLHDYQIYSISRIFTKALFGDIVLC